MMKEQGYDVIGVTIKFFFDEQEDAVIEGEKAAKELGIDWYWADYTDYFKDDVMSYFIRTYMQGKTPNPCAHCNRHAKFNYLFREMKAQGASKIITGHYARKVQIGDHFYFKRGLDPKKDQSYYLTLLKDYQREVIEFPLGEMDKADVKAKAVQLGLSVAEKDESQDICFLMDGDYRDFLEAKLGKDSIKKKAGSSKTVKNSKSIKGLYTIPLDRGRGLA